MTRRERSERRASRRRKFVRLSSTSTTTHEIAWAAGIYEGEGATILPKIKHSIRATVTQVDPWLLHKFRGVFGGALHYYSKPYRYKRRDGDRKGCWHWSLNGSRAVGFLLTIYTFLSPRRRTRIREAIAWWRPQCMQPRINGSFTFNLNP